MQYVNISAYLFVTLHDLEVLRTSLLDHCNRLALKGTILLAPEGINIFLSGTRIAINEMIQTLRQDKRFNQLEFKESFSSTQPFQRMLIHIKKEIITMRIPTIQPEKKRAPTVSAKQLKIWLDQKHDDIGREVVILDTRNQFEINIGTFTNAVSYGIAKFTEFPQAVAQHIHELKDKTIVSCCTGGIRCEKAAIHMHTLGLNYVYQLEGGILKYFEEVGAAHYQGHCFVFDERIAVTSELQPINQ